MLLAGHQPVFLPGIVVMNKFALADCVMLVSHCQFVRKSWHSHNLIRGANGPLRLTVPTQHGLGQSIAQTKIEEGPWKRKHLGSIKQFYSDRPFFNLYYPQLEDIISMDYDNIAHLNIALIFMILEWLKIETQVVDSRQYQIDGQKTLMLIDMCRAVQADAYLSSPGEDYVDRAWMRTEGIAHHYQTFEHPVYDQGHEFIPNLSVIDLLFNCGPKSAEIVRECGSVS